MSKVIVNFEHEIKPMSLFNIDEASISKDIEDSVSVTIEESSDNPHS